MTKTYNGWTNYATWLIALQFFDGFDCDGSEYPAECLQDIVIESLEDEADGLALSYAMAFINDVNWHEIAEHLKAEAA
jgi:hypothetical protein